MCFDHGCRRQGPRSLRLYKKDVIIRVQRGANNVRNQHKEETEKSRITSYKFLRHSVQQPCRQSSRQVPGASRSVVDHLRALLVFFLVLSQIYCQMASVLNFCIFANLCTIPFTYMWSAIESNDTRMPGSVFKGWLADLCWLKLCES